MERRDFIKKVGGFALGTIVLGDILSNNIKAQGANLKETSTIFPEDELRQALTTHFNKFYNGEMLDIINNIPISSKGKAQKASINLVDGFEIEIVKDKNTIFEVADQAIKLLKEKLNFDASDLKKGVIPENLVVIPGAVMLMIKNFGSSYPLPELKNYDAKIILKNPIKISSKNPIKNWANVQANELKEVVSKNKIDKSIYYATEDKLSLSIVKMDKDNTEYIVVKKITPNLVIENQMSSINFISKEKGLAYLNQGVQEFIKINIINSK